MSTPEHSQRVPVMIAREYLKWSGVFWNDGKGKRDPEARSRLALHQTLHQKSLTQCLPAGVHHIAPKDVEEIIFIFENLIPKVFSEWCGDILEEGERDTNVLRIAAEGRHIHAMENAF